MSDYTELKRLAEKVLGLTKDDPEWDDVWNHYENASLPEVVLALIAENERNAKNSAEWESASLHWMTERDQLKAENQALRDAQLDAAMAKGEQS